MFNIYLNCLFTANMHSNTEKDDICGEKGKTLPTLHLTPSAANQRKSESSPQQRVDNPWLLKPQHEIPPTPPPQGDAKPIKFFQQRIG